MRLRGIFNAALMFHLELSLGGLRVDGGVAGWLEGQILVGGPLLVWRCSVFGRLCGQFVNDLEVDVDAILIVNRSWVI